MPDTTTFAKIDARVIALDRIHDYFMDGSVDRSSLRSRMYPVQQKPGTRIAVSFTPSYCLMPSLFTPGSFLRRQATS